MRVRYHDVRVSRVIEETTEASSFVLDAPFSYAAGQFVTFRVTVAGREHLRCYSMSSAPAVDEELTVTVKRVPGGLVSNWLLDNVAEGSTVEITEPAGAFRLRPGDGDLLAFAAGSGITPIQSLLKEALATTDRRVRLLYANRDEASIIFRAELDGLVERHAGRLTVEHHLDVERGFVDAGAVARFAGPGPEGDVYVCGPAPFMDVVEGALVELGVERGRIAVERFTPGEAAPSAPAPSTTAAPAGPATVTIELGGRVRTTEHRPGTTILQTARELGLSPPYSCESGSCATCMARCVEGSVSMFVNAALTDDEVAEGWILTCQSVPAAPVVHVVYEGA